MASPALGHEGNPNFRSEIDSVRPHPAGLEFEVLSYDSRHGAGRPRGPRSGRLRLRGRALRPRPARRDRAEEPALARDLPQPRPLRRSLGAEERRRQGGARLEDGRRLGHASSGTTTACTTWPPARRPRSRTRGSGPRSSTTRFRCGSTAARARSSGTLFWVGPADTSKLPFAIAGGRDRPARRRRGSDRPAPPAGGRWRGRASRARKPGRCGAACIGSLLALGAAVAVALLLAPSAPSPTRAGRHARRRAGRRTKQQPERGRLPLRRAGRGQLRRRPRLRRRRATGSTRATPSTPTAKGRSSAST